jgi:hypothetical protein
MHGPRRLLHRRLSSWGGREAVASAQNDPEAVCSAYIVAPSGPVVLRVSVIRVPESDRAFPLILVGGSLCHLGSRRKKKMKKKKKKKKKGGKGSVQAHGAWDYSHVG